MDGNKIIDQAKAWAKTESDDNFEKNALTRGFMMGVLSITGKEYWREMFAIRIKEIAKEAVELGMGLRQNQLQMTDDRSGNEVFEEWFKNLRDV